MIQSYDSWKMDWLVTGSDPAGDPVGLVGRIQLGIDVDRLRAECHDIADRVPWTEGLTRQVALQCRPGSDNPWYEACVRFEVGHGHVYYERDFTATNPALRGTYLDELLTDLLPFRPCRARLMAVPPATCYSVHRDRTTRFHLAVDTSMHSQFVFVEHNEIFHIPSDGNAYLMNTHELHTALNGGDDLRTHIVLSALQSPQDKLPI